MKFSERLGRQRLFFDGGMGSVLQEQGLKGGELPETWNLLWPDRITAVNRAYFEAGSDVVCTNTFGANRLKFPENGQWSLEEIIRAAVENAKRARELAGREDGYIALDIGPSGKLLQPMGDLGFEDAVELFGQVVRIGAEAGADLIVIETMSDSLETKAAVLAAKENSSLPVIATNVYGENGKLLTGGSAAAMVAMLEGLGVDALGVNCGLGPRQMLPIVKELLEYSSLPVVVNPNAGLPKAENGRTVYSIGPEEFAGVMRELAGLGAHVLGGCCGTTPEHIKALKAACADLPFAPPVKKHRTLISSWAQAVEIGAEPVIIGERINPTGKSKFKQALREHNIEYILNEGFAQEEAGAHILDVNVGLPEIDEPALLEEAVKALQGVIGLPLQIDTSDFTAMEKALRCYNGKAMINSVSGKKESMEAVFPLVKKYGGVVVGLALDESGIPETAEGRVEIARKIYKTGAEYGIAPEDIVIDGLTLTVSSDSRAALTTLETIERVKNELGGKTILGVSNVSFGLPKRELVNSNFFTMALQKGLSCAIINPISEAMMGAYRAFRALSGQDLQFGSYISAYGGQTAAPAPAAAASGGDTATLEECIEKGMASGAGKAARAAIDTGTPPLELVNRRLIPALDKVGQGFEKGTVFLPQLLMSAEAAKAAFEVVKDALKDVPSEKKGKIVLATVKGDIHDIGKNIVKVLLENYGFDVIDLGKDVPPEKIVEAASQPDIKLVGLSALMTTTVVSMEETIRLIREQLPDTKVVVGGAVLTPEYAEKIRADRYARDAMATVHYAQEVYLQNA